MTILMIAGVPVDLMRFLGQFIDALAVDNFCNVALGFAGAVEFQIVHHDVAFAVDAEINGRSGINIPTA